MKRRVAYLSLGLALVAAAPSHGQDHPGPAHPRQVAQTIDLEFEGGTLGSFVAHVREAAGAYGTNILLREGTSVRIPAMRLRRQTVQTALLAASELVGNEARIRVKRIGDRGTRGVIVVTVEVAKKRQRPAASVPQFRVISIRSLTEDVSNTDRKIDAKTVLTAIDTGLGVIDSGAPRCMIRYHADSGLLFVAGTRAQTALVSDVVSGLRSDLERERAMLARANYEKAKPRTKKTK